MRLKQSVAIALLAALLAANLCAGEMRRVVRVIDGDTIIISGPAGGSDTKETIRLIGIDAPESRKNQKAARDSAETGVPLGDIVRRGKVATAFVSLATKDAEVWIETEKRPRDMYGRTLGYVHLSDGSILNEVILWNGYATVMRRYKFGNMEKYLKIERDAMRSRRGLWAESVPFR